MRGLTDKIRLIDLPLSHNNAPKGRFYVKLPGASSMKRVNLAFSAALVPLDYLALVAAAITAYSLRFATLFTRIKPIQFNLPFNEYLSLVVPIALVFIGVFALSGLYTIRPRSIAEETARIFLASSSAIAVILAIAFFSREFFDSRFIILAVWLLAVLFVLAERLVIRGLQRSLRQFGIGVTKVAVIGKTKNGNALVEWFQQHLGAGYASSFHTAHFGPETEHKILALKDKGEIDAMLLANPEASKDEITAIKIFADNNHLAFLYAADLFPGSTLRPRVHTFAGQPVIEVPTTALDGWGAIYKRAFDIVISLLLILLTLPLQIVVAILLFCEQPGGILFRRLPNGHHAMRIGQGGKPFPYFKFRSMVRDAHKYRFDPEFIKTHGNMREGTPLFKLEHDPRVTRVGKFIRKYSIDEIPEFYLVLFGRMSLVGPRPHLPEEVALYQPSQRKVLTIKPGITGLAQISGRAELDFADEVGLDMHYIENWSPWLDILILLKTPITVLSRKGAY